MMLANADMSGKGKILEFLFKGYESDFSMDWF
jgi:hypothetical protein